MLELSDVGQEAFEFSYLLQKKISHAHASQKIAWSTCGARKLVFLHYFFYYFPNNPVPFIDAHTPRIRDLRDQ
jgi:hypothetical protein